MDGVSTLTSHFPSNYTINYRNDERPIWSSSIEFRRGIHFFFIFFILFFLLLENLYDADIMLVAFDFATNLMSKK